MATRIAVARRSFALASAALIAAANCGAAPAPAPGFTSPAAVPPDVQNVTWDLRLPADAPVVVNGVVSFDTAGTGSGGMLYAGGLPGLLVGIAVHSAIESSAQRNQKIKMQEAANQVLTPYKDVLEGYRNRVLLQDAVAKMPFGKGKKLLDAAQSPGSDWVVETAPTFLIAQDQHAFIIDNAIAIYSPSDPKVPVYRNTVHAVSRSRPADTAPFWIADQGIQLKEEFSGLYAMSVDVALQAVADGPADNGKPFRTIRYMEGGAERIERAQVLREQCGRVVIKSLRGALMSVPVVPEEPCEQAPVKSVATQPDPTLASPVVPPAMPSH